LGRENLVKATVSGSNIKLNLLANPQRQIRQGDRLTVKFDLAPLFVFEVNNGETVNA
jgi:hypothetical protein